MKNENRIITILVPTLRYGGGERVSANIINGFINNGYNVNVILFDNNQIDYKISENVKIISLNERTDIQNKFLKILSFIRKIYKLKKILKNREEDLLSIMPSMNILSILSKNKKQKLVITEHNILKKDTTYDNFSNFLKKRLYKFAYKIISVSEGVKSNLLKEIKNINVEVIYNPLDINEIKKQSNIHFENNYGDFILGVGRLHKQKGFDLLIKALSLIKNKNINLVILGEGEEKKELMNIARNSNVLDRVKFIGFQKNPYNYMKNAKLFVLSSRYEGFGMVLAEALISNANIISFNCNYGPSEILINGNLGLLINEINEVSLAKSIDLELANLTYSKNVKSNEKDLYRFEINNIIKSYQKVFND